MASFRIFHLRDSRVEAFRRRTPEKGTREISARDYMPSGEIEAESPYLAWKQLTGKEEVTPDGQRPRLDIGDVIQPPGGEPLLCNYWGFDAAAWKEGIEPELEEAEAVASAASAEAS